MEFKNFVLIFIIAIINFFILKNISKKAEIQQEKKEKELREFSFKEKINVFIFLVIFLVIAVSTIYFDSKKDYEARKQQEDLQKQRDLEENNRVRIRLEEYSAPTIEITPTIN